MLCNLIGRLYAYIACVSIRMPIYLLLSYGSRQLKHFLIGSSVAYFEGFVDILESFHCNHLVPLLLKSVLLWVTSH